MKTALGILIGLTIMTLLANLFIWLEDKITHLNVWVHILVLTILLCYGGIRIVKHFTKL